MMGIHRGDYSDSRLMIPWSLILLMHCVMIKEEHYPAINM